VAKQVLAQNLALKDCDSLNPKPWSPFHCIGFLRGRLREINYTIKHCQIHWCLNLSFRYFCGNGIWLIKSSGKTNTLPNTLAESSAYITWVNRTKQNVEVLYSYSMHASSNYHKHSQDKALLLQIQMCRYQLWITRCIQMVIDHCNEITAPRCYYLENLRLWGAISCQTQTW
jgi:hypothetical protein